MIWHHLSRGLLLAGGCWFCWHPLRYPFRILLLFYSVRVLVTPIRVYIGTFCQCNFLRLGLWIRRKFILLSGRNEQQVALAVNAREICWLKAFSFGQFDNEPCIDFKPVFATRIHMYLGVDVGVTLSRFDLADIVKQCIWAITNDKPDFCKEPEVSLIFHWWLEDNVEDSTWHLKQKFLVSRANGVAHIILQLQIAKQSSCLDFNQEFGDVVFLFPILHHCTTRQCQRFHHVRDATCSTGVSIHTTGCFFFLSHDQHLMRLGKWGGYLCSLGAAVLMCR